MKVSFIIPLFNRLDLTRACLESLQATLPAGLAHEILLVDDGSTDGTRDWLRTLPAPCRILLNERNLGYAVANNRGAASARGEILALLNSDLVLLPHWVEPMLDLLQRRPRAGVVGNVHYHATTGALDHAGMTIDAKARPAHDVTPPPRYRPLRYRSAPAVTAACALVPGMVFRQLGGLAEDFHNGGEDVDFCFRARAAGFGVFVALHSRIRHHVSASPGRKLHDEANSRRLAHRWGEELVRLSAHHWCRGYLQQHWAEPRDFDRRAALQALLFLGHLLPRPPAFALAGQRAVLQAEEERWTRLLGPWSGDPVQSPNLDPS